MLPALALTALAAACGGGASLGVAAPADGWLPGLRVHVEERFYPVAGTSPGALNRALASRGPRRDGRAAHALTEWHVVWSYEPVRGASGCVSGRPSVTVQIVTTLPRWTDLPTASDRLISDWALFLARLRDHESRHQHLALEGSRELLASLSGLEAPSCALLHARAEGMASSLAARYDAEHVRVDESSDQDLRRIP